MRKAGGLHKPSGADRAADGIPALPAWKAFVVQFSRETGTQGGVFAGRVEHLSSGERVRFESEQDLLAALQRLLEDIEQPSK